jgi:hypothetical protein
MKGNSGKFAKLIARQIQYLGPVDLIQYFVKDTSIMQYVQPPDTPAVKVSCL